MVRVVVDLTVRDLTDEDLSACGWSGSATHLAAVAGELARVHAGQADYLAVCPPSNLPVAIGGIDHEAIPGAGWLHQLAVHPALQSCGIGTVLITAAEQRIVGRGLHHAGLHVEETNTRARSLYERLGYVAYDQRPAAWDVKAPDGSLSRYETVCAVMRKDLSCPCGPIGLWCWRDEAGVGGQRRVPVNWTRERVCWNWLAPILVE